MLSLLLSLYFSAKKVEGKNKHKKPDMAPGIFRNYVAISGKKNMSLYPTVCHVG